MDYNSSGSNQKKKGYFFHYIYKSQGSLLQVTECFQADIFLVLCHTTF